MQEAERGQNRDVYRRAVLHAIASRGRRSRRERGESVGILAQYRGARSYFGTFVNVIVFTEVNVPSGGIGGGWAFKST